MILVVLSDTTSIRSYLYKEKKEILSFSFERIGLEGSFFVIETEEFKIKEEEEIKTFNYAVLKFKEKTEELNLFNISEVEMAFRMLHGRENTSSIFLIESTMKDLLSTLDLSLLSNRATWETIEAFKEVFPDNRMSLSFETAFFKQANKETLLFPTPLEWHEDYNLQKTALDGLVMNYFNEEVKAKNKILVHFSDRPNIAVIKDNNLIYFTGYLIYNNLVAGNLMGEHSSGLIDPAMILYIMEKEGKSAGEVVSDLSLKGGILGLRNKEALEIYKKSVLKEILLGVALLKKNYKIVFINDNQSDLLIEELTNTVVDLFLLEDKRMIKTKSNIKEILVYEHNKLKGV